MERFHGLHHDFKPAAWRGTTNTDGEFIGLSLDLPDGSVARYALDVESALAIADTLQGYINAYRARTNVQPDVSSGMPSPAVSPQDGQNV